MTRSTTEPGAETPQQKADRIAEARRKRRANQTVRNLIGSLVASLAIVLFLVLVVVRPDPAPLTIDYLAAAAEAEASLGTEVVAPIVPPTWSANRAELGKLLADPPRCHGNHLHRQRVAPQAGYQFGLVGDADKAA